MKILWITNTVFPYPCKFLELKETPFGGWLLGLFKSLKDKKDISLAVASIYNGSEFKIIEDGNVIYYLLPKKKNLEVICLMINEDFKPDLLHIHGTEFSLGYVFQKVCKKVKTVVSIQGLVNICADNYIAGINNHEIKLTFRDLIRGSIYKEQREFYNRGIIEKKILKNADAIIGRTTWDYANSYAMTLDEKYYKCNESLRDSFYDCKWDIKNIERHSIYISQGSYPLKGFHVLLKAVSILKKKYSDIKVYVAGNDITKRNNFIQRLKISGYGNYIIKMINNYNLQDNIIFTGVLNEQEVVQKLLRSHVYVQTSSIENSPNSLGEAMLIGMPCVVSYVGGTMDMLVDKKEGYLYPFGDYGLLSYYISKVFNNDEKSIELGKNAKKHANNTHNSVVNANRMVEIYREVVNKK